MRNAGLGLDAKPEVTFREGQKQKAIKMSIRKLRTTAAITVLALGVSVMQASIITENVVVAPTSSGVSGSLTFLIPQFDPTLGTLNSVELTLTPTFGDFGSQAFNMGSATTASGFTVSHPYGSLVASSVGLTANWSSSSATITSPAYTALGSYVLTRGPALSGFGFTTTPAPVTVGPTGFSGLANYNLAVTGSAIATVSGNGTLYTGWWGNVGGNLEVDFNYTPAPVPEPTTMVAGALLLLPFGVSTLRMLRRRTA